jgi:hypothetical protein
VETCCSHKIHFRQNICQRWCVCDLQITLQNNVKRLRKYKIEEGKNLTFAYIKDHHIQK